MGPLSKKKLIPIVAPACNEPAGAGTFRRSLTAFTMVSVFLNLLFVQIFYLGGAERAMIGGTKR